MKKLIAASLAAAVFAGVAVAKPADTPKDSVAGFEFKDIVTIPVT